MQYKVVCIKKSPTHYDKHHHITAIGIEKHSGVETISAEHAVAQLDSTPGDRYHLVSASGIRSEVIVHACPVCGPTHRILTTTRDETKDNNLLSLPECGGSTSSGVPPRSINIPGPVAPPRPPGSRPVG